MPRPGDRALAYRHAVETTVYVAQRRMRAAGSAARSTARCSPELARRGFHCAMGGIALPNAASVALHESMGFVEGRPLSRGRLEVRPLDRRRLLAAVL